MYGKMQESWLTEIIPLIYMLSHFCHVWLFATLWTIAFQAPLSMGFSRQEYWSVLPCPPPGDLPGPWIEPACLLHWQVDSLNECHLGKSESESHSVMSDSLWPHELQPSRLLCPWNSPGENTGVGLFLTLLQGIFPTQGSNPCLPYCRWTLYHLSHQGRPRILEWIAYPFSRVSSQPRNWTRVSCTAGRFLISWATREVSPGKPSFDIHPSYLEPVSCFHILSFLRAYHREWLQPNGC